MTPKEAFKDLFLDVWKRDEETNKKQSIVLNALTELEELKRYPTSEEVCEALSEYYHYEVEYSKRDMTFESELSWYACFKDGVIDFGGDKLPPHLITLIGRFYEGVGK
jgi:hypothetical protein